MQYVINSELNMYFESHLKTFFLKIRFPTDHVQYAIHICIGTTTKFCAAVIKARGDKISEKIVQTV